MKLACFNVWLFLIVIFVIIMYSKGQKYRMDYMWAQSSKTYYRVHDLATTWHQARQICEAEGTSLLVPENLDEIDNLKILISNMKAYYTAIFLGLHDQYATGLFVDLKGQPIKGTILNQLWGEGLPDNYNFEEHCVVMNREGLFDDKSCDEIYPFVCKIKGIHVKYNSECDNYESSYKRHPKGKCYNYHVEPLTWHDAYMVCKMEEGDLAVINSAEEAALVTKFLGDHLTSDAPNPNILLLGFSDLLFPFQYRTINGQTLEEAGYSSWSPTKEEVSTQDTRHCGAISRTGFLLMTSCDEPAMFLCEKLVRSKSTELGPTDSISPSATNTAQDAERSNNLPEDD